MHTRKEQLEEFYIKHHSDKHRYNFLFGGEQRGKVFAKWIGTDKTILDLGCRDGSLTKFYRDSNYIIGIDIDKTALELCKNNLGIEVYWHDLNESNLPFKDLFFDVVVAGEVLEHLYYPELLVPEVVRVLKPNGVFIGSVPNAFRLKNRLLFLLGKQFDRDKTHIHQFSEDMLRALLAPYFSQIELKPQGGKILPIFPNWWAKWLIAHFPNLFALDLLFRAVK